MVNETPTGAEGQPDPDPGLAQLVRSLAVAHARQDHRRATGQISPDDAILALLCQRPQATAAEIGITFRLTADEVQTRLSGLESRRLIVGRHDARLVPPARVFTITGEGRRKVDGVATEAT